MARVCKKIRIINNYLDQIDDRNALEKERYGKLFNDYTKLLNQNRDLQEKLNKKSTNANGTMIYDMGRMDTSMGNLFGTQVSTNPDTNSLLSSIRELEKKIVSVQESKIESETITELTLENKNLTKENQELNKTKRHMAEKISLLES